MRRTSRMATRSPSSRAHITQSRLRPGSVSSRGTAMFVVTPQTVIPGPGVEPGAAPYADELLVTIATTPPSSFVVPISGPERCGTVSPRWRRAGHRFARVFLLGRHHGLSDAPDAERWHRDGDRLLRDSACRNRARLAPVARLGPPGSPTAPELTSAATDAACPGTTNGTIAFFYAGPVCQPFSVTSINVHACAGALP